MNSMKAIAFSPGHISGFFEPIFHNNILKTGSRGAGFNISLGAKSEVIVNKSNNIDYKIYINGKKLDFPIIPYALNFLTDNNKMEIIVKTKLDLPLSQGFGMSAASVLSASYAFSKIVNKSYFDALKASHISEIHHKSGLGDVISCSFGGIEIRTKPGIPPWGVIKHILGNYEIVLCVIDDIIDTKKILNDQDKLKVITKYGNFCTNKIIESPTIDNLFLLSKLFTEKTKLASKKVIEAIKIADEFGNASMCMLGNSIFAIGKTNLICNKLKSYGKIFICNIDKYGTRLLSGK
jgi:pantoate kinase